MIWFTYKKYIFMCLTVMWTGVIFSFSLQPASKSEMLSDGVGQIILEYIIRDILGITEAWTYSQWELFHVIIRKFAHFAEFFVLGLFMILMMNAVKIKYKRLFSFIGCVIVASCDEMIQLFVPGRSGMPADVVLDSVGSLCAIIVCTTVMALFGKRNVTV